jgi:glycerol-3-phosphate O-acyltransferase/dihydroxyacetone phosphate acyltransferase
VQLIQAVRRLYNHNNKKLPLGLVVELNRRLVKGYERYKDDSRIVSLKKAVLDYNKQLLELQIRDHQVEYARLPRLKVLWLLGQRIFQLALLALGVLPGLILFSPVFVAGKLISIRKSKEALAASTVKIHATDVMATWKLLVSLALAPAVYLFYAVVLLTLTYQNRAFGLVPPWVPLWLVVAGGLAFFPLITYAALRFGEVGMDIVKSLPPLFAALSPWHGRILTRLRRRRARLVDEVTSLINELGPELYPDFEKVRIIPENGETYFDMKRLRRDSDETVTGRARQDSAGSEPASPATPYGYGPGRLPRNESFQDLANIGFFASRPATPHHHPRARSRNNSVPGLVGLAGGSMGFSPLESQDSMEEISKRIRGAMRERSAKRRNTTGGAGEAGSAWEESEPPTPDEEGVSMAKKGR